MNNKYPNKLKFHSKENPEEHYVIAWKIKPKQMKRILGEILTKCNEILEIAKKNKELDLIIFDLKKQLSNYKDLPTEINQMKNLVEIKKEEYKALLIDKKVNNL